MFPSTKSLQIRLGNVLALSLLINTAQKMKFSIKDFFSKCEQIRRKLRIWSDLLNKSLIENFIFGPVKSGRHSKQITDFTTQGDMGISNSQRDHDYYQIPARVLNKEADFQSRSVKDSTEWKLNSEIFQMIYKQRETPDLDLFGSRVSQQFPVYMNWKLDSVCKGRDAFQSSWTRMRRYAFSPFLLVGLVLSKVQRH